MECPICNFSELNEGAATCPQCQSDLEVFRHLEDARNQHHFQKKAIAGLAVLLVIAAVGWGATRFFSGEKPSRKGTPSEQGNTQSATIENPAAQESAAVSPSDEGLKKENETLTAEVSSLKTEIKSLNEKLNAKESSASSGTITHIVKEGESLWKIAEKYYKDGYQFKKIADENGVSDPKSIRVGTKLKISK